MRIEKSKPGKKSILKNLYRSLIYDQKTSQKVPFWLNHCFWLFFGSFLAINLATIKIFRNAFFSWLRFFNTHLLMYIYLETKKNLTCTKNWVPENSRKKYFEAHWYHIKQFPGGQKNLTTFAFFGTGYCTLFTYQEFEI